MSNESNETYHPDLFVGKQPDHRVMHPDLFGGETPQIEQSPNYAKKFRLSKNYRLSNDLKNCSNCRYSFRQGPGARAYRKCRLMGVSNCASTDVSRRCICNGWTEL